MRAVTVVGGRLEWREHADPQPGAGELLIRVQAAGINGADLLQRGGGYPVPPGAPADIPGLDVAGEVEATGPGVERFRAGDRVMALVGGGGQAELAVVHERVALPVPDGLPWPEAGGFPEVFTTAHDALFTQCGLGVGEHVLVHGAAGGVGIAAVQLAAIAGARVTATVRNPALHDEVRAIGSALGPTEAVASDDFAGRGPFDVVLELIGAPNLRADLDALATGGRIAVIGVSTGATVEINLLVLMAKRARLHGSMLRPRPLEQKADAARRIEAHVLPGLRAAGSGTRGVHVPVAATYHMADAEEAYERFAAGGKLGKIVLVT